MQIYKGKDGRLDSSLTNKNMGTRPKGLIEQKLVKLHPKEKIILTEGWFAYKDDFAGPNSLCFCLPGIEIGPYDNNSGYIQNSGNQIIEYVFHPQRRQLPRNPVFINSKSNWPGPAAHVAAEEGRAASPEAEMYEDFLDECHHITLSNRFRVVSGYSNVTWQGFKFGSLFHISTKIILEENLVRLINLIDKNLTRGDKEKIKSFILKDLITKNRYTEENELLASSIFI